VGAFGDAVHDAASRIAYAINADPVVVWTKLAAYLKASDPAELGELLDQHEGELVYLAYTDSGFAEAMLNPGDWGAFAPTINTGGVSTALAARLAT
jgi:hypothetical protein